MLQQHKHDELFPTPAADQIRGAAHLEQVPAQLAEYAVADGMAMGVVDALEMVDVDQDYRKRRAIALRSGDLLGEELVDAGAVP